MRNFQYHLSGGIVKFGGRGVEFCLLGLCGFAGVGDVVASIT